MQTLGERVAAARELRGMTQGELAARLRGEGLTLDAADVSRIETGRIASPGVDRLRALARVLRVSGDYLLGLDDPPGEAAGDATPPSPPPGEERGGHPLDDLVADPPGERRERRSRVAP